MAKLESQISRLLAKFESEDRIKSLSYEETAKIDMTLANKLKDIKRDYELKERKSRAYISRLELTSLSR